jgi:tetratricopeptide (TPR) repeat protein
MILKYSILLGMLTCWLFVAKAQETNDRFDKANTAYVDGNFKQAEEIYSALIEEGYATAELYYNLGNTYYRQHKTAEAILFYEKAIKLEPRVEDYIYNLGLAKERITNPIEEMPEFFLDNWWRNVANFMSSTAWSIIAIFFLWAGVTGGVIWLLAKNRLNRKLGFFLGLSLLMVCILPFLLANSNQKTATINEAAIVMQAGIELKTAPESEKTLSEIPSGTKVKLVDVIGEWHKVQLPNGEIGWLPGAVIEKI